MKWSKNKIIKSIKLYYKEFNVVPIKKNFNNPTQSVVRKYFGSWNNAIISAGLPPRISSHFRIKKDNGQINKRLRFSILIRDNFTCQYCGRKAPEVKLQVDHKTSIKDGGKTIEPNLITSCWECNLGKFSLSLT